MASPEASSMEKSKGVKVPNFTSNCVLLSSWVSQNPFLITPLKLNNILPSPNFTIRELHSTLTSTADKCLKIVHLIASQNPILEKLLSFSSDIRKHLAAHQLQCRAYRKANYPLNHNFAAVLPGDSVAGVVVANGILNFLSIYNTLLIIRLVLTWFPNSPPAIVSPLSTLCDPYLNIFRGIIPPLGGTLDLSPILAFLVLNAFTSTAAALPAELPQTGAFQGSNLPRTSFSNLTSSQEKWMRRVYRNKPHGTDGAQ